MTRHAKPKVFVVSDFYLPGYKSGGGMRTVVNMVDRMRDRYDFHIVTRDHDGNRDKTPYSSVHIDQWNQIEGIPVHYISDNRLTMGNVRELFREVNPDIIYSNSVFTPATVRLLQFRKLGRIRRVPMIIAPCGELSSDALRIKAAKKKAFVTVSKGLGLFRDVLWKASSEIEFDDIRTVIGANAKISVAPDLPPKAYRPHTDARPKLEKRVGKVRLVFFSRFVRIKNFSWLLELLGEGISGEVELAVIGPIEDAAYWTECERLIARLPANVRVINEGPLPHENVLRELSQHDFFILPSLSENFGHVLLEALAAGCPLIVSDRTPWRDLEAKAIGWDIPLSSPDKWRNVIDHCTEMGPAAFEAMANAARSYAEEFLGNPDLDRSMKKLFETALDQVSSPLY